jgi:DNA processing protein
MPASADPLEFVALSLLPWTWWRDASERLRAGCPAGDLLDHLLLERPHDATAASLRARAAYALARGRAEGITCLAWSDPRYPPMLTAIAGPPFALWLRGSIAALEAVAVAIVGSRAGSAYALAVAERLAADLTARGLVVVSGLARGVDSAAHRGAVGAGGATIGVLGSGVDIVYPHEHRALAAEIEKHGAVVSELVPGTPPQPQFFPLRNRIISGLSRAVVVVEAGEKSGSLITARLALEQGRDVLSVPGNVLSGRNRGGHGLLRDGAKLVETADDIIEELNLASAVCSASQQCAEGRTQAVIDPVLACLTPGESCDLDAIAARAGIAVARLLPRLFELELQGLVRRAGGGRFVRFDSSC